MAGTFLKWLIPGVVTIIGGTALAIAQTGSSGITDLSSRAAASLDLADFSWAAVTIDGRDAIVTGTATTPKMIEDVTARLASVHGIRSVTSNVALAELLKPFPFAAIVKNGAVTLTGAYPSEIVHAELVATAGTAADQTKLYSGAPEAFAAGAKFGLQALSQLDDGEIRLADLALSIAGRAKSAEAFDALQILQKSLPAGVQLAALKITPPLASPYIWTATFDGTTLSISGDAPTADLADKLRALAPANVPVSTTLSLASGEPSGFEANTLSLLHSLLTLEQGEASISDGTITLIGAPATSAIADQIRTAMTRLGGTATLEPPRVAEFAFSIDKSDRHMAFNGFVSDKKTIDRLAALPGADVSKLALGRGAPARFASAIDFGLSVLDHLADGQFGLKGARLSIGGRAATVADFKAANDLIAQGAPQGLNLAAAELHPPVASPFTWSAVKAAGGLVTITGYVPNDTVRKALETKVTDLAADSADPADGAPRDFAISAGKGLDVLALLDSGSLTFDGNNWAIDGNVDTPQKGFAADAAYSVAALRTAGWSYAVHLPEAKSAAALPIIAPYVWRAQKTADGAVSFTGFVPSEGFKSYLAVRADKSADITILGAGAPADFGTSASAGLDALLALDEGALALAGEKWTLTGTTVDAASRDAIQSALSAKINTANWQVAIQAKDSAPVVTPYLWSATKAADGTVELAGYLPNESLKNFAAVRAGSISRDTTAVASGEPSGFAEDVLAGLDALTHMANGKASFDGSKWHLSGDIATAADGDAAVAALHKGSKNGASWDSQLTGPPPAPSSSEPSSEMSSMLAPDITSLTPSSASSASSSESSEPSAEASSSEPIASVEPSSSEPPTADREIVPETLEMFLPMPGALVFEASLKAGGSVVLKGSVPADATASYFGVLAGNAKIDGLTATTGLTDDFIANGTAGLNALMELGEGHLGFDGTRWWLRGKAEQSAKDDVTAKIAALPKGADWSVGIDVLQPIDICRIRVGALAGRNAIVFKAGSTTLMASSLPVLDELANDLEICRDSYVHVQGHTDADGDADGNLALSVSRAEAVIAELIRRGVDESRLYAEGFGESDPIAPNDTKDGKAKNRRIAFDISKE
ncbi:MAG: OmpA family protein [Devosia sp.]